MRRLLLVETAGNDAFGKGLVRPDGRALHEFHLFQVKQPTQSRGPRDDYKLISTIPGSEAFRLTAEGGCKLVS